METWKNKTAVSSDINVQLGLKTVEKVIKEFAHFWEGPPEIRVRYRLRVMCTILRDGSLVLWLKIMSDRK